MRVGPLPETPLRRALGARRTTAWVGFLLTLGLALGSCPDLTAASPFARKADPNKADTSRTARESAIRSLPFDKLDADSQARVKAIVSNVSIFRRLPIRVMRCDPDLYLFLVEHPNVVINIWEVLGVSRMTLTRVGEKTFGMTDVAGMSGTLRFLYSNHDTHLIYSEGAYDGPLLTKPVTGRGLMLLKTGYIREPDGNYYITSRLDSFIQLDNRGVELITKTLQPVLGKIADANFAQATGFVGSLSRTAEVDLNGMLRLADRLSNVEPDTRKRFIELSTRIAFRAAMASDETAAKQPEPIVARRPDETEIE